MNGRKCCICRKKEKLYEIDEKNVAVNIWKSSIQKDYWKARDYILNGLDLVCSKHCMRIARRLVEWRYRDWLKKKKMFVSKRNNYYQRKGVEIFFQFMAITNIVEKELKNELDINPKR